MREENPNPAVISSSSSRIARMGGLPTTDLLASQHSSSWQILTACIRHGTMTSFYKTLAAEELLFSFSFVRLLHNSPEPTANNTNSDLSPMPPTHPTSFSALLQGARRLKWNRMCWGKSLRNTSSQSAHVRLLRLAWVVALIVGEYGIYWVIVNRCDWPENSAWVRS